MRSAKPVLTRPVQLLAVQAINRTQDGSVGYDEAVVLVGDGWAAFEAAGASLDDVLAVHDYIRWAKWEGFCAACPL